MKSNVIEKVFAVFWFMLLSGSEKKRLSDYYYNEKWYKLTMSNTAFICKMETGLYIGNCIE
jgi:hypothetical protein